MKTFFGYDFPEGDPNFGKLFGFGINLKEPKKILKILQRMNLNFEQARDLMVATCKIHKRNPKYYARNPHKLPNDTKAILSYFNGEWTLVDFNVPQMLKEEREAKKKGQEES